MAKRLTIDEKIIRVADTLQTGCRNSRDMAIKMERAAQELFKIAEEIKKGLSE